MNDFLNRKLNIVLSKISDVQFREDVKCTVNLLLSLAQNFSFEENKEGKHFLVIDRKNIQAKRMMNLILGEEYGIKAFFVLKDCLKNINESVFKNKNAELINHTIQVCRYFQKKLGIYCDQNYVFSDEVTLGDIEDKQ